MPPVEHNPLHAFLCREIEFLRFLGMDQNSIAAKVGISHVLLSMMLNGYRRVTLKRAFAITELLAAMKDEALRDCSAKMQETSNLPPSAKRDRVLRQWIVFQTQILKLQHRGTQALRHFAEQEITTIRHGMSKIQVVVDAFIAKGRFAPGELEEAQKGGLALSQALQELAEHASILAHCTDELAWLEEQIKQGEEIATCQPKRPAARSSAVLP